MTNQEGLEEQVLRMAELWIPKPPSARAAHEGLVLLARARELVGRKGGWTQEAFARDHRSQRVRITSWRATRFCVTGALLRAAGERYRKPISEPTNDAKDWSELEPFKGPAALQAALWALALGCLDLYWYKRPAAELYALLKIGPERFQAAFTRLPEMTNDAHWMRAHLALEAFDTATAELRRVPQSAAARRKAKG